MKIAQIAPLYEAVPPKLYGGTERIVAYLADALVEPGPRRDAVRSGGRTHAGHAGAGTRTGHPSGSGAAEVATSPRIWRCCMMCGVAPTSSTCCISTSTCCTFRSSSTAPTRTVTTLHGRLDLNDLSAAYWRWPQFPLVSISNSQRKPLRFARLAGHGAARVAAVDCIRSPTHPPGGYLAFLGRISPEKRPDRAIAIAKRAGMPLEDRRQDRQRRPRLLPRTRSSRCSADPLIEFVGEIDDAGKGAFLGNARRCCSRSTGPNRSAW